MSKTINFLDTFSGMGGFRIGFEEAAKENGYIPNCVGTVDIKGHAVKQLSYHFKEAIEKTDITKLDETEIEDIDVLLGGFPCQAFSMAGKRLGFEDTRGTLFYELARIMKYKKPRFCIFENVKGLINHDHGHTLAVIVDVFHELGYHVTWQFMDTKDYGLAGKRPRIFIVCHRDFQVDLSHMSIPMVNGPVLQDILEDLEPEWNDYTESLIEKYPVEDLEGKYITDKKDGINVIHSWEFNSRGKVSDAQKQILESILKVQTNKNLFNKYGKIVPYDVLESRVSIPDLDEELSKLVEMNYIRRDDKGVRLLAGQLSGYITQIVKRDKKLPTIVATDIDRKGVVEKDGIRRLTSRELLRALGYSEDYEFSPELSQSHQYDLLGNTLSPHIAKLIVDAILKQEELFRNID